MITGASPARAIALPAASGKTSAPKSGVAGRETAWVAVAGWLWDETVAEADDSAGTGWETEEDPPEFGAEPDETDGFVVKVPF
jgi:hypothetical protein